MNSHGLIQPALNSVGSKQRHGVGNGTPRVVATQQQQPTAITSPDWNWDARILQRGTAPSESLRDEKRSLAAMDTDDDEGGPPAGASKRSRMDLDTVARADVGRAAEDAVPVPVPQPSAPHPPPEAPHPSPPQHGPPQSAQQAPPSPQQPAHPAPPQQALPSPPQQAHPPPPQQALPSSPQQAPPSPPQQAQPVPPQQAPVPPAPQQQAPSASQRTQHRPDQLPPRRQVVRRDVPMIRWEEDPTVVWEGKEKVYPRIDPPVHGICKNHARLGFCGLEDAVPGSCKFDHAPRRLWKFHPLLLTPDELPWRPQNATCWSYMWTGKCQYRPYAKLCPHHHPPRRLINRQQPVQQQPAGVAASGMASSQPHRRRIVRQPDDRVQELAHEDDGPGMARPAASTSNPPAAQGCMQFPGLQPMHVPHPNVNRAAAQQAREDLRLGRDGAAGGAARPDKVDGGAAGRPGPAPGGRDAVDDQENSRGREQQQPSSPDRLVAQLDRRNGRERGS